MSMVQTLEIRQKARWRKIIYSKPMILFLVMVFVFVLSATWGMFQKSRLAGSNATLAEEAVAGLENRERALSEDIVGLSTERGIEEEIRERFMVAKMGERVIIIADPEEAEVHTVTVVEKEGTTPSFLAGLGASE